MRPQGGATELQRRRAEAIRLLRQGSTSAEVACVVGCDRRSVTRWKASYRSDGLRGLRAKPVSGRPPKIGDADKTKLRKYLLRVSREDVDEHWTCSLVRSIIEEKFGVRYSASHHMHYVLHSIGLSLDDLEKRRFDATIRMKLQAREADRAIGKYIKKLARAGYTKRQILGHLDEMERNPRWKPTSVPPPILIR